MKKVILTMLGLAAFGMVSATAIAGNSILGQSEGVYSLTKSCGKGMVRRAGHTKCTACPKGTHANKKQTKCYWNKKKMHRGSYQAPKKTYPKGSY